MLSATCQRKSAACATMPAPLPSRCSRCGGRTLSESYASMTRATPMIASSYGVCRCSPLTPT
eukprot:317496-Chlamydomonas_euryale.AAC.2